MNERERKLVLEKLLQEQNPDSDDADCQAIAGTLNVPEERVRNVLNTVRRQKEHDHEKMKNLFKFCTLALACFGSATLGIFSKLWLNALDPSALVGGLLMTLNLLVMVVSLIFFVRHIQNSI